MKMKELSVLFLFSGIGGSLFAMEGDQSQALAKVDAQKFVESYSQVLAVAGGLNEADLGTIQVAMEKHFDLSDVRLQEYVSRRQEDLNCIVRVAECHGTLCEDLKATDKQLKDCMKRQSELLNELDAVNIAIDEKSEALVKCSDQFRADISANDNKLNSASFWAYIIQAQTSLLKNRGGRAIVNAGRYVAPSLCVGNLGLATYETCSTSALACAAVPMNPVPYVKLGLAGGSYLVFRYLHNSGQTILQIIRERQELEKKHLENKTLLKQAIDEVKQKKAALNSEQKDSLLAEQTAADKREQLELAKKELHEEIARGIQGKLVEMNARNIQNLREALQEDQNNSFVHGTIVTQLQNILDATLVNVATTLTLGEAVLLLTQESKSNKPKGNIFIEDVTE